MCGMTEWRTLWLMSPLLCAFLQIDYDIRVSTSPSIKTVCEIGFHCGQSAVVWLEANPGLKVLTFDDLGFASASRCLDYINTRYPGRLELIPVCTCLSATCNAICMAGVMGQKCCKPLIMGLVHDSYHSAVCKP